MNISEAASQSSGLAPVQSAVPQGMVPVWAVGNANMVVPANTYLEVTDKSNGRREEVRVLLRSA